MAAAFALTTVATTAAMSWAGARSARLRRFAFLDRFGEALSGGLIALTGLVVLLLEPR